MTPGQNRGCVILITVVGSSLLIQIGLGAVLLARGAAVWLAVVCFGSVLVLLIPFRLASSRKAKWPVVAFYLLFGLIIGGSTLEDPNGKVLAVPNGPDPVLIFILQVAAIVFLIVASIIAISKSVTDVLFLFWGLKESDLEAKVGEETQKT